jgi:hypothetical protein
MYLARLHPSDASWREMPCVHPTSPKNSKRPSGHLLELPNHRGTFVTYAAALSLALVTEGREKGDTQVTLLALSSGSVSPGSNPGPAAPHEALPALAGAHAFGQPEYEIDI